MAIAPSSDPAFSIAVCVNNVTSSTGLDLVVDSVFEPVDIDAVARKELLVERANIGWKERRDPPTAVLGAGKNDGENARESMVHQDDHDDATSTKTEHLMVKFPAR